jgi:ATP-dependent helicase HepA
MTDFVIGQRWVSHADAELGLGIIVEIDLRRVTVHFPAVGEDRTYASDRAPLTRLLLKEGDSLLRHDGHRFTVTGVSTQAGIVTYVGVDSAGIEASISELELDPHIQLSSPEDRLLNNQTDKLIDFSLRYATQCHRAKTAAGSVRGLLGARTALLSHQMYIAAEVGSRFAPRVLLADEVGLGKTIEAGLILSQQLLTERAHRVLIVVPDPLLHQWLIEMLRRFNLHFALFDETRLEEAEDEFVFESEQLVLCGFSLFADSQRARLSALDVDWDLVIVDEAHHLNWESDGESHLYQFVTALAETTKGLLLLTATPEQAGIESHFARLQLLDPARFADFDQFIDEQRHYAQWNTLIEAIQRGEEPTDLPEGIDANGTAAEQIQQLLDRFGTGRVLFRNTRASVAGFPKRTLEVYPLEPPMLYHDFSHELYPERYVTEAQWLADDPRVHWLEDTLRQLKPNKVLVICAHQSTALALEHHLHLRAGIRCAAFHEGLTLIERDRAAAFFADEVGGAQALICSEIGSEGRNFQFAHHLICFDLPLNPDLLEQRIGRLDRIGQTEDVKIHVPVLENSAQRVLFDWLHLGLAAFTHPCAVGHAAFELFEDELREALDQPQDSHEGLHQTTAHFRQRMEADMQAGRDKLLELNSHNPQKGAEVISSVREQERPEQIEQFAELLFDRIGVNQDLHSEGCYILKPSEVMITGDLPGLDEDGITATFDRTIALARDDFQFLTWEHPLIREAMDIVASSGLGNAVLGTVKHPRIKPGTVLLEAFATIDCLAPNALEVGRYIDMSPLRFLLTPEGKDVANALSHDTLSSLAQAIPIATSASVIRQVRPLVEKQLTLIKRLANDGAQQRRFEALQRAAQTLGAERERLVYLNQVNPTVRPQEIESLDERIEATEHAIAATQVTIDGLRLLVAM